MAINSFWTAGTLNIGTFVFPLFDSIRPSHVLIAAWLFVYNADFLKSIKFGQKDLSVQQTAAFPSLLSS